MKNTLFFIFIMLSVTFSLVGQAQEADWSRNVEIITPRENIYNLPAEEFKKELEKGKKVSLFYPVTVGTLFIPYYPLKDFFESDPNHPVRKLIFDLTRTISPIKSMNGVFSWLGLHEYPLQVQAENPNPLPHLTAQEKELPIGATLIETQNGTGLTFGCAACHSGHLFGVTIMGLTNRFPRANEFFHAGKTYAPYINTFLFKELLQTTEGERVMMANSKATTKWIGVKKPTVLGLDTSVAQVALSLAKREADPYAAKTDYSFKHPRFNKLETMVADSKPAVWWNVKYKTRWTSDGSVVSGNPVHTNFIWNELGRGADLKKLEEWMDQNQEKIRALTIAVFASKAPRYEQFFGPEAIDLAKAQKGQKLYVQSCQKCHGVYEKAWDSSEASTLSLAAKLQTTKVTYHKTTPVKDVGTDPGRYLGMQHMMTDFNRLHITQKLGTIIEPQKGYVPPPLVGIWSRWPYFHNNSIPNLCALLTISSERPKTYVAGEAIDKKTDFDQDCVGYPLNEKAPESWKKKKEYFYDTRLEGLSNSGHDMGILIKDGKEVFTTDQKKELIEFLKTL